MALPEDAWARLEDENGNVILSSLEDPTSDIILAELDPGAPTVRAVSNDHPARSGALDTSMFTSARAVSMTFKAPRSAESSRRAFFSTVMPLLNPSRRPRLVVYVPEWGDDPWSLELRADSFTAPLTIGSDINLTWVNPSGYWESETVNSIRVNPVNGSTGGIAFPFSFPMSFGTGTSPGSQSITVGGSSEAVPKILIYGPITSPAIINQSVGKGIYFNPSESIAAGEYWEIDVDQFTILSNSDITASRFGRVNWSLSDFFLLEPGINQITLTGASMSGITQAVISWRDRRI